MALPIRVYGDPILRQQTDPVEENTQALQELINEMIETMHGASGLGLAAPQVGRLERLFVIDVSPLAEELEEEGEDVPPQPMVFINPELVAETRQFCDFEEGCLSIPEVREVVTRPDRVTVRYRDREFTEHEREFGSMMARVIQHEYDHLEGVLFVDHISAFRRQLLRRRLRAISRGDVEADYPLAVKSAAS